MLLGIEDVRRIARLPRRKRIGLAIGTFDLLHPGHAAYLNEARAGCDILYVCVRNDIRVRLSKGRRRPILNQRERTGLVSQLRAVDNVYPIDLDELERIGGLPAGKSALAFALALRPDVVFLGSDWAHEKPIWDLFLADIGCEVRVAEAPYEPPPRTTTDIFRLVNGYSERDLGLNLR